MHKREKLKALLNPEVIVMIKRALERLMVTSALGATGRAVNGSKCPSQFVIIK